MKYTTIKGDSGLYSILDEHNKCIIMCTKKMLLIILPHLKEAEFKDSDGMSN